MIHRIADRFAKHCVANGWIEESKIYWCRYAIEKRLGTAVFVVLVLIWLMITKTYIKTLTFVIVLFAFRRRIGGWHSQNAWSCQIISIGTVVLAVSLVGPAMERLALNILIFMDVTLMISTFFINPVYPAQAHFSQAEKHANAKRKNILLLILCLVQGISWTFMNSNITVYSFLGLAAAVVAVALGYFLKIERSSAYESN